MDDSFDYSRFLFKRGQFRLQFVPLPNGATSIARAPGLSKIDLGLDRGDYPILEHLIGESVDPTAYDSERCRLVSYDREWRTLESLPIELAKTTYYDYLRSAKHLDDLIPGMGTRTYRDQFVELIVSGSQGLHDFGLSSICGVGTLIRTSDDYVVLTKHPSTFHVYPDRWTFSASGSMHWGAHPDPFIEAAWKCREALNHQVNTQKLQLVEFGVDARKLFFQFCFIEHSNVDHTQIKAVIEDHKNKRKLGLEYKILPLKPIENSLAWMFDSTRQPSSPANPFEDNLMEPAAAVTFFILLEQIFGKNRIQGILTDDLHWKREVRRYEAIEETDDRALRDGVRRVLSVRYPPEGLEDASETFLDTIMDFMKQWIRGARVLEVGCGIGRVTNRLFPIAKEVVATDISKRMLNSAKEELGDLRNVVFVHGFAEDSIKELGDFDVSICSLVLIHTCDDEDFKALIGALCKCSKKVFVFEDVTRRATSPYTHLRPQDELVDAFNNEGFELRNGCQTNVCGDEIAMLEFGRIGMFDPPPPGEDESCLQRWKQFLEDSEVKAGRETRAKIARKLLDTMYNSEWKSPAPGRVVKTTNELRDALKVGREYEVSLQTMHDIRNALQSQELSTAKKETYWLTSYGNRLWELIRDQKPDAP